MPRITDRSTLTTKSQVTIPKNVRETLGVGPGDQVLFKVEDGAVSLEPIRSRIAENFGKVRPKRRPEDFKKVREVVEKSIGRDVAED